MKYLLIILPVVCAIALWGCEQELPVPASGLKARTVVYSELVAGSVAEMRIGKSKPVGPYIDNKFELVPNASIHLMDNNGQLLETLVYKKDTASNMSVYKGNQKLAAGKTYKIEAMVPDMKAVTATTTIPVPFKVELLDTLRTLLNGRLVLRFHFNVLAIPGVRQYLVMEALKQAAVVDTFFFYHQVRYALKKNRKLYNQVKEQPGVTIDRDTTFLNQYQRIPCYTQDENADNNQVGGLNESYNTILFTQTSKPLTTYMYINATGLTAASIEEASPVGRVLVYVKSVSKDYYDFLLTYEKVKRNPGLNSLVQAIMLKSNTPGGIGIVGGVTQQIYYLYYDKL